MMWHTTYRRLNLHAGTSNIELIRRMWRKVDRTKRGRDTRAMRHELYRVLIEHHANAREVWELFK